ncbi:fibrous sheath CABYR-binding protein [Anopheles aquasalis]|uniref:fibrous sheath CABYR-binding protein n=1 Tax=Anopheles aquasalis TaxID=42839 RepID=UPI00215AE740|nr:fibrous sheath CABYR-binding protein [Anopheles aquasalis]
MSRSSVTRNAALVLALCLTVVLTVDARILPARSKQVKVYSYVLPAGAEEIRDDISHSFACGNRSDGFYVDIDNDCQIFHRCQDKARFSFICAERTVFSQMYQTCVHDGQLGYPCEDSVQYYPEGEGYEPSAMEAGPESSAAEESPRPAQQPPSEDLEAPQAASPSKASEITVPKEEDNQNDVNEMTHDNESQADASDAADVMVKDEPEHQQQEQEQEQLTHQQVNADLFDSIEEETDDQPSENTAQEVMDETDAPVAAANVVATPTEEATADTTSQEDTQEVEVQEDDQDSGSTQPIVLAAEPFTATDTTDADAESSPSEAAIATEAIATPVDEAADPSEPEPDASAASLLNAVQMVEELEPIVHDIPVENAENDKPQASGNLVVDPTLPIEEATSSIEDNEVLPEMDAPSQANMDVAPLTDTIAVTDADAPAAPEEEEKQELESDAENDAKVNEPAPTPTVADESSESEVIVSPAVTDSDEAEVADVKPTDEEEQSVVVLAGDLPNAPELPERPLESPAIVEEMAPMRSHDSVELPELIVSTEFHLEAAAATQRPPIRRRKTFLFRADAIRSKHH